MAIVGAAVQDGAVVVDEDELVVEDVVVVLLGVVVDEDVLVDVLVLVEELLLVVVLVDGEVTVSVAAFEFVEPNSFVNTARYLLLFMPDIAVNVSVGDVAPVMFVNVVPPSLDSCHWNDGPCVQPAGLPAAAVNVTVWPTWTDRS